MSLNDVWRNLGERISFNTRQTASDIPELPGVYAWFLPLWLYEDSDLNSLIGEISSLTFHDSDERTYKTTSGAPRRESVSEYCWDAINVRLEKVPRKIDSSKMADLWKKMILSDEEKRVFERSLMEATIFTKPLYVGKASNLRSRYEQHIESEKSDRNVFGRRLAEFAAAQELSIRVSDLLYVTISMPTSDSALMEESRLNELLEYVLKIIVKPPFGAR